MFDKLANGIAQRKIILGLLALIVVILAASGLKNLSVSNDYRIFFDGENQHLQILEELESEYTNDDSVMIVVNAKQGSLFQPDILAAIKDITEKSWLLKYSQRVDSLTNYQHTYVEEDDLTVDDLVRDTAKLNAQDLLRLKNIAVNEPSLLRRLVNPDATVTAIIITYALPGESEKESGIVTREARELRNDMLEKYDNIEIRLAGMHVLNTAFEEATESDMGSLVPLCYLIVFIGIGLFTRSFVASMASMLVIICSIVFALGVSGWGGTIISSGNVSAPIMIMTLAVADCLHLLSTFFFEYRSGKDKKSAVVEAIKANFRPILLTSLTTIIGFLSLNFSDSPPYRSLGNIVAIGSFAALFFTLTLLPALLLLLPVKQPKVIRSKIGWTNYLADFVIKFHIPVVVVVAGLFLAFSTQVSKNEVNDIITDYLDTSLEVRRDTDFAMDKDLASQMAMSYSISSGKKQGINDPVYLDNLERLVTWLRDQPEVIQVNSYIDTIKRLNKNLNNDDKRFYTVPGSHELAAQYLLLYELSLPFGLDITNLINHDKSATKLVVSFRKLSSVETIEMEKRAQQWISANLPKNIQATASSPHLIFAHIGMLNIKSMLEGTLLAIILISLLLILTLRSVKYGLVSLLLNLTPAFVAFGIWGVFVGQVGLSVSIVTAMSLGIVVDYTIHFLSKYQRAVESQGMGVEDAIRYVFNTVGNAVLITTVVLVLGFGILMFSPFALNADMGALTAGTITIAFISVLFLLPPILLILDRKRVLPELAPEKV